MDIDGVEMRTTDFYHNQRLLIGIYVKKICTNEMLGEYKWQYCHMWDDTGEANVKIVTGGSQFYDNYDDCVLAMNDYVKEMIADGT
jgi:hypothetical protein